LFKPLVTIAVISTILTANRISMNYQDARTYRGTVQLVVFDWAGTTVDFGCQAPVSAFVEGFRQQGVHVSSRAARIPMGMEKRDHIRALATQEEVNRSWREVHGRDVTENDIDTMYNAFASLLLESIEEQSNLIPGVLPAIEILRAQGIKIGASTGYFKEAAEIVARKAAKLGYSPDFTTNCSEVPAGRPQPWMIYRTMEALRICPPEAVVNIGDTPVDIESGLNGGVWTVGIAATGNQLGLTETELKQLSETEYRLRLEKARDSLYRAGAHYVIDTMQDLPQTIEKINKRLASREKP
jgi:phosphonoacetaldehyde hydrolase